MQIRVCYQSIDGARKVRKYKSLQGARKFAAYWVGENPDLGSNYAISGDGVGKIMVEGCSLRVLFGHEQPGEREAAKAKAEAIAHPADGALALQVNQAVENHNGAIIGSRGLPPEPFNGSLAEALAEAKRRSEELHDGFSDDYVQVLIAADGKWSVYRPPFVEPEDDWMPW